MYKISEIFLISLMLFWSYGPKSIVIGIKGKNHCKTAKHTIRIRDIL